MESTSEQERHEDAEQESDEYASDVPRHRNDHRAMLAPIIEAVATRAAGPWRGWFELAALAGWPAR